MSTRNYLFWKITSFACLLGSGLNSIFQLKAQSRIFTKSLFIILIRWLSFAEGVGGGCLKLNVSGQEVEEFWT